MCVLWRQDWDVRAKEAGLGCAGQGGRIGYLGAVPWKKDVMDVCPGMWVPLCGVTCKFHAVGCIPSVFHTYVAPSTRLSAQLALLVKRWNPLFKAETIQ